MAYTYEDFTSAATKAGLLDKFSAADLQTARRSPEFGLSMLSLMRDSANATTGEQKLLANEAANQLRQTYGSYTVGADGATSFSGNASAKVNDVLGQLDSYGSFTYDNESDYQKLLESLSNPDSFDYNLEADPVWQSTKKSYLREADKTMSDTLARASAATGGLPSTYAVSAAAQAANNYKTQLNDLIPTLYASEYDRQMSALSALESDRADQYQKWADGYNALQSELSNYRTQEESEYARYLNMLNLIQQEEQLKQQEEERKFNEALTKYQLLGYATPDVAEILGIPSSAPASSGSGAGTTSSQYTGGNIDNGGLSSSQIAQMQQALKIDDDGLWGPQSQAAAMAAWGTTSAADAWTKYQNSIVGGTSPTPGQIIDILNKRYPSGRIWNQQDWDMAVDMLGSENALRAEGFRKADDPAPRTKQPKR